MKDEILRLIGEIPTPGFFVTAEFSRTGQEIPAGIEAFIGKKLETIRQGSPARKFTWQAGEWRIIFTFFPTDRVVDERYALKNKVLFKYESTDFDLSQ